MSDNPPYEASPYGVSWASIAAGASHYVLKNIVVDPYFTTEPERKQQLADLVKNIDFGDPTIVITEVLHAVIVIGTSWHELATANPQHDYMIVHDPLAGANQYHTIGEWLNTDYAQACGGDGCEVNIQVAGRKSIAVAELAEFDSAGGVYYGTPPPGATGRWKAGAGTDCYWDPNDSGPDQCSPDAPTGRYKLGGDGSCYWDPNDSGPDQCSPSPAPLVRLGTAAARLFRLLAQTNAVRTDVNASSASFYTAVPRRSVQEANTLRSVRQNSPIPRPWGETRADVVTNFYAAVAQTRLDRMPGLSGLRAAGTDWHVSDVFPVESLGGRGNYNLVIVADGVGRVVGSATLDREGWLLAYQAFAKPEFAKPISREQASTAISMRTFHKPLLRTKYVYAPGNIPGMSQFSPLLVATRDDGQFYVNGSGQVFQKRFGSVPDGVTAASAGAVVAFEKSGAYQYTELR